MAINSKHKRFGMLQFAAPWAAGALLFAPDTSGLAASERAAVLHLYGGTPPFLTSAPPVATPDSATATTAVAKIIAVAENDAAVPPAELAAASVTITVAASNGTAVANADNTVTYTSDAGYTGSDTFTYRISDTEGLTATAEVSVTVEAAVAKAGGIGRKRRRVMIDYSIYRVESRAEERALLEQYIAQQRQQLETAEPAHEPVIRAKIRRAERRRDKVADAAELEAAEERRRVEVLIQEDEEILLLLVH